MTSPQSQDATGTADIPYFPMSREAWLPVRPARAATGGGRAAPGLPGPDLERQHPVDHHRARRAAGPAVGPAGERERPAARLPALARRHGAGSAAARPVGVQHRPARAHPLPADDDRAVHLQAGQRDARGGPGDHRRPHRPDAGRPPADRPGRGDRAAAAEPDDLRHYGRAVRGPEDVLGPGRDRDEEGRQRRGPDGVLPLAARLPRRPGKSPDDRTARRRGLRPGAAGNRRRHHGRRGGRHGGRAVRGRPRDQRQHDRAGHRGPARAPRPARHPAGIRRPRGGGDGRGRAAALPRHRPHGTAADRQGGHRDRGRDHHRPARASSSSSPPRTATPASSPTRTFSTCAGKPRPTMRSVSACTSASASSWRGSNCRWCTARSSGASPP